MLSATLVRELVPQVLGQLVRRYGNFGACEDAVQEALLAAAKQWPAAGVPENARAWLRTVASRRLTDELRSSGARRRREDELALRAPADQALAVDPADLDDTPYVDDELRLLFMCCHPQLSAPSQIALTLRAVGGLSTEEIARAFLVPDTTMGQRISRAKQTIKASGVPFEMPPAEERASRLAAVLHVLYLIFNEGYTSTSGDDLTRSDLTSEAIRLTRMVRRDLPDDGEVAGLLALMLLIDARRAARTDASGALVPLAEQDRSRWDHTLVAEGVQLVSDALASSPLGPYQLQAAINAVHAEARSDGDTDWPQIVALYELLALIAPNPMVTLNHAVAVGMARGPQAGLVMLEALDDDNRMATHHRLAAVRAYLQETAGDNDLAAANYRLAARRTTSIPERRYLEGRANRLQPR